MALFIIENITRRKRNSGAFWGREFFSVSVDFTALHASERGVTSFTSFSETGFGYPDSTCTITMMLLSRSCGGWVDIHAGSACSSQRWKETMCKGECTNEITHSTKELGFPQRIVVKMTCGTRCLRMKCLPCVVFPFPFSRRTSINLRIVPTCAHHQSPAHHSNLSGPPNGRPLFAIPTPQRKTTTSLAYCTSLEASLPNIFHAAHISVFMIK